MNVNIPINKRFPFVFKHSHILLFLLGLVLSLSLLWPLVAAPYFTHQDDIQWSRLYEMHQCIKDLQIPCRWVPDLGGEYGYPLFNFYAPLPYYFGEIFYLLTHQLLLSAKIMFAASFVGCYVFMFLASRKVWGNLGGMISGVFYSFLPYHALDFYVRGAMGELWALMFYPAVFWGLFRLYQKKTIGNAVIVTFSLSGLALSHNLSTMIFAPFLGLIIIFFLIYKKLWKTVYLKYLIFALLGAFLIASFYVLPVLFEKNLVHVETTTEGYFHYTEHFKGLKKLFIDRGWAYGSSEREVPGGPADGMSYQIGWMHLIGWIMALWAAVLLWQHHRSKSWLIILSSISIIISVFMIHPLSYPIWHAIPPLVYVQFPWRFLGIIGFFICFLAGSIFYALPQTHLSNKQKYITMLGVVSVISVVVLNFSYFKPAHLVYMSDSQALSGKVWDSAVKRSIFDFLPIYAKAPPAHLARVRYTVMSGTSRLSDYKQGSDWFTFNADTNSLTFLQLSQYYFPDWQITIDGKQAKINYQNPLGLMSIFLDPGVHTVWGRLHDTLIRRIGNMLSLLGILLLLFIWIYPLKTTHKFLNYIAKGLNK